ncbi:DNA gyrase subunit A [Patescibacteria group bacterium]|nr:DNA gyrase subunit A [Patescibacteria group bacterium]
MENKKKQEKPNKRVETRDISQEMKDSYLSYAMSVIVSRAIPDARDGLKPVHRRVLYAMHEMGLTSSSRYRKSANVVGITMAYYHPHGDMAIYDSMARLAQDFSMRYPSVDGQGNWGSVDGDSPAAARYCLTGNSLILTNKGVVPIKEIGNKKEEKINYKVLNYQGKEVNASKFFNSGKHKIIEIITEQGYKLQGSYNHPVLCWCLNEFGFPSIKWKTLKNISNNDYVLINRNFSLFNKDKINLVRFYPEKSKKLKDVQLPKYMNKDLAFLLGTLVSEGSFHQEQIIFNNKDLIFYEKIKKIILNQFKGVKLYERKIKGGCMELSLYYQRAVRFLNNIGLTNVRSDKKEIPFSVLLSNKEIIREFLIGLFEGDGSVSFKIDKRHDGKHLIICYDSKSEKLIEQLKVSLLNFGIISSVPQKDKRNDCYKISISGFNNVKKFKDEIGFFSNRKKQILEKIKEINSSRMSKTDFIPFLNDYLRRNYKKEFISKNNFDRYNNLEKNYHKLSKILKEQDKKMIDWILKNKFFFNKIKTVNKFKKEEIVYSIKVDNNCHSFVSNGFINHNTEAKLSKFGEMMLNDIEKDTVDFVENYDGTRKEPAVLPSPVPNLLLNGTMGIAVGMATNIPPHNLNEVVDATCYLSDNPKATIEDLFQFIKGPDFPTGGEIYNKKEIMQAYVFGKGPMMTRAKAEIVEEKGKMKIIISELTYLTNKSVLLEKIANLVKDKKIQGVRDIRDESDKDGIRVVIELKSDAFPQKVLNKLYKYTELQKTFHLNTIALTNGIQPQTLSLKQLLEQFIIHRKEVITRRLKYELNKAKERVHILEGLAIALRNIDKVIALIKKSKDKETAKKDLIKVFKLTEIQASAILEMKLQTLAGLERKKILDELEEKKEFIKKIEAILSSPKKILKVVKDELLEIKEKFGDQRKTKVISSKIGEFAEEDLIPEEETIITVTNTGYIKRVDPKSYRSQRRGGKGIIGIKTKQEDFVEHFFVSSTHDDLLFFSNTGKVFKTKAYEIPEANRASRGRAIVNILGLSSEEKINAVVPLKKLNKNGSEAKFLAMVTEKGIIKRIELDKFINIRKGGIVAITMEKDDNLKWVKTTSGDDEIMLMTRLGQGIKFSEKDLRPMGRSARGVRGIKMKPDKKGEFTDGVVGMTVIGTDLKETKPEILIVSSNGFGKRTPISAYKTQKRGGVGIKAAKVTDKTGVLVAIRMLDTEFEDLIVTSKKGNVIRTSIKSISQLGRVTQGVKIMRLDDSDKVVSIACV